MTTNGYPVLDLTAEERAFDAGYDAACRSGGLVQAPEWVYRENVEHAWNCGVTEACEDAYERFLTQGRA